MFYLNIFIGIKTACYCIQSGSSTLSNITKFGCFCKKIKKIKKKASDMSDANPICPDILSDELTKIILSPAALKCRSTKIGHYGK